MLELFPVTSRGHWRPGSIVLFALVALLPLSFAFFLYEPFTAAKELVLVGGAALLMPVWIGTSREFVVSPLWAPVAALAGLGTISLLRTGRFEGALLLVAALVLFAAASTELRDGTAREQLSALITAVGTIEAVYVLWQTILGDPLALGAGLPGKWRGYGTFGNPNWTGEFLAVAILVTWGRLLLRRSLTLTICAAMMTAALAATFARGSWISLAVGAMAIWICARDRRKELQTAAGLAAAAFLAAVFLAYRADTAGYLAGVASIRGRLWMVMVSSLMLWHNPLGIGLGAYGLRFPEAQAQLFATRWSQPFVRNASFTDAAHNDYLQLTVELGLVALPVLAWLVWRIGRRGLSFGSDTVALGLWAALVSTMVNALYSSPFYLPGSLGLSAILLGAAEAASPPGRSIRISRRASLAAAAAAIFICCGAWWWCWRHGMVEYRLAEADKAIAMRDWPQASAMLAAAGRLDPARIDVHAMQGRAQLAQRQFTVAAETYARAAGLGFSEEVFAGRATALWHAGRTGEALAVLEQLVRLRPDLQWPRSKLAELRAEASREEITP